MSNISNNKNDYVIKQKILNNFNNNSSNYEQYDDPTYLTFNINFFPNNFAKPKTLLEINGLPNNNTSLMTYNDMPEPLLEVSDSNVIYANSMNYSLDLKEQEKDYDIRNKNKKYSTINYLKNSLGEIERSQMLEKFINLLIKLNWEFPYYIKSIDGIQELLTVDSKRGSRIKQDAILTIKCYESLDQKINTLKTLYKKIVWDDVYMRWVLPDMMRFFRMTIDIYDFRIFHDVKNKNKKPQELKNGGYNQKKGLSKLDVTKTIKNTLNDIGKLLASEKSIGKKPWILTNHEINNMKPLKRLECRMCEFDISNMFNELNSLSANNPKEKNTNDVEIKIKVGNIKEIYNNSIIDFLTIDDEKLSNEKLYKKIINTYIDIYSFAQEGDTTMFNDSVPSRTTSYLGKAIKNTVNGALQYADNYAEKKLNKLMTNKIGNSNLSFNDWTRAITSADVNTMYNVFKTKAKNTVMPVDSNGNIILSEATSDENKMGLTLFEKFIEEVANANDPIHSKIAQLLLDWGENNASSIDDYMSIINEATTLSSEEEKEIQNFIDSINNETNSNNNTIIFDMKDEEETSAATNDDVKIIL